MELPGHIPSPHNVTPLNALFTNTPSENIMEKVNNFLVLHSH